jgi:hypothetical protein
MSHVLRAVQMKMPLSGNVSQAINPWTWNYDWSDSQVGLININLGESTAPEVEHKILDDVGSYGKQLGRMADVVQILLKKMDKKDLTEPEKIAICDFEVMLRDIEKAKAQIKK